MRTLPDPVFSGDELNIQICKVATDWGMWGTEHPPSLAATTTLWGSLGELTQILKASVETVSQLKDGGLLFLHPKYNARSSAPPKW